jgi:hypothetical protein
MRGGWSDDEEEEEDNHGDGPPPPEEDDENEPPKDPSHRAVWELCNQIMDCCNIEDYPLSCVVCYKLRKPEEKDLFLTSVLGDGAPDFVAALVTYLHDFGGRLVDEYEEGILKYADVNRKDFVLHADPERYRLARNFCEELYKDHVHTLEYVLILLECPPDYRSVLEEGEYIPYLFRETASLCPRIPYPMITSVVQLIKRRLELGV